MIIHTTMEPEYQINHVSICLSQVISSEEDFLSDFREIEGIDQRKLPNRYVGRYGESPFESYIMISNTDEGFDDPHPNNDTTQLLINTMGDGERLHIHANIDDEELVGVFNQYFKDIISIMDTLTGSWIGIDIEVKEPFNSFVSRLNLPVSLDTGYQVNGLRVSDSKGSYIIQDSSEIDEDDNSTSIRYNKEGMVKIDSENVSDFIEEEINNVESFVGGEEQ